MRRTVSVYPVAVGLLNDHDLIEALSRLGLPPRRYPAGIGTAQIRHTIAPNDYHVWPQGPDR